MARIVHIFTFRAFPSVADGVPLTEAYDFGRFSPHLVNRPGDTLSVTSLGQHDDVRVATDESTLAPLSPRRTSTRRASGTSQAPGSTSPDTLND